MCIRLVGSVLSVRLDVGCGNRGTGDVNVDLYVKDVFNHRNMEHDVIRVGNYENFVCCDARFLPFVSGVFSEVFCSGVIEHVKNPQLIVGELCRVCGRFLVVETVHKFGEALVFNFKLRKWFREHHVSKLNFKWLRRCLGLYGFVVERSYNVSYTCIPSEFVCLFRFPLIIGVECFKC